MLKIKNSPSPHFFVSLSHFLHQPLTQNAAVYSTRVHALGRYVFILHYHQPLHPTYPVQVYINGGRIWHGKSKNWVLEIKKSCRQCSPVWRDCSYLNIISKYIWIKITDLYFPVPQVTPTPLSVPTLMAAVTSWSLRIRSFWMWRTTRSSSQCRYLLTRHCGW